VVQDNHPGDRSRAQTQVVAPLVLKHDQGSAFTGEAMKRLLETWHVGG
jgi:hypothetical protein